MKKKKIEISIVKSSSKKKEIDKIFKIEDM